MNEKRDAARRAALAAGGFVKERFLIGRTGGVVAKGPRDFVTEVDTKSEAMIKEALSRDFPSIGFLAEETAGAVTADSFWIIDPLDGTTNFIHGYPFVAISIALMEEGRLTVGCAFDPLRGELFEAEPGAGARLNGKAIHVSGARTLDESLLGTGFPFGAAQYIGTYLGVFAELFRGCRDIRRAGAAVLDLCHVAAGRLDGFWELYLRPWDMAAGSLIVREAGGIVGDFFGDDDYLERGNIVAATPAIFDSIVAATRRGFAGEDISPLATHFMP